MKAVIQRIKKASLSVNGQPYSQCGKGYLILLCIMNDDEENDASVLANKIAKMRIFEDENEKINLSIKDVCGEMMIVSQFTLSANCVHGNRPDFFSAARPDKAIPLYEKFISIIKEYDIPVCTGVFGEHMDIDLTNDGPFTVFLDSNDLKKKDKN